MPSGIHNWSQTAATNSAADSAINWAEGQAPSSVNDSSRAMMAVLAKWRDDISGAIVTGGTSTAYTLTSYSSFSTLALMANQVIAFTPNVTNGATVTLNVDGLGAKPLRAFPGVELQSNVLIAGTPYVAIYNNSSAVFYLQGNAGGTYGVPLGGGMDYWGTTAPSSAFVFPTGQAVSRTTYATLFTLFSTTYGVGDGSTTFNLPDPTGRVRVIKEATATRVTTAGSGIDGGTLGAAGGAQTVTLAAAQIPAGVPSSNASQSITVTATRTIPSTLGTVASQPSPSTGGNPVPYSTSSDWSGITAISGTNSISVTSTNGAQTAVNKMPPAIVCNYILRII